MLVRREALEQLLVGRAGHHVELVEQGGGRTSVEARRRRVTRALAPPCEVDEQCGAQPGKGRALDPVEGRLEQVDRLLGASGRSEEPRRDGVGTGAERGNV